MGVEAKEAAAAPKLTHQRLNSQRTYCRARDLQMQQGYFALAYKNGKEEWDASSPTRAMPVQLPRGIKRVDVQMLPTFAKNERDKSADAPKIFNQKTRVQGPTSDMNKCMKPELNR